MITNTIETDVIVIGGGATGAGIARDATRRGLKVVLLERYDIATGATGRNHGLLHSGARYAVTDSLSARECIRENKILKRIARHCIEETDGLFLTLPEDDLSYQTQFITACHQAGIETEQLDAKQAIILEPAANPQLLGAVRVPDGTIDPFRLTSANIIDAREHGGQILTYHEVKGLIRHNDRIIGVSVYDHYRNRSQNIYASVVVNAGGIWGQAIAEYADLQLKMSPSKGALLILGHRLNNRVLNRCRKPADADILVPGDTVSVIGTTSTHIDYSQIDNMVVTSQEVDTLIREGAKLAPLLKESRILRAYAGVRPLIMADNNESERNVSRGIMLFDHGKRDGLEGLITITGGKLMTYRLMAELTVDTVCEKLNHSVKCDTADHFLPGSVKPVNKVIEKMHSLPPIVRSSAIYRHGDRALQFNDSTPVAKSLVCECEAVSYAEIRYAVRELNVNNLIDLRRRTRVGMGTCQGELCACRAAGLLNQFEAATADHSIEQLAHFLNERWKGTRPIAWDNALRESEFTHWLYQRVCGLSAKKQEEPKDAI